MAGHRAQIGLVLLAALVAGPNGCDTRSSRLVELERVNEEQRERIQELQRQVAGSQQSLRQLRAQLMELRGMKGDDLEHLVYPVKIEIEGMSGGYDNDGKAGDDGIVLYIRPIDRDGHVVKSAGTLKVVLYDLANPPGLQIVQDYYFDEETVRSLWYGRLWTHHFTVRCPWPPSGPPDHDEITADVVFTPRLTGEALRAQQMFRIAMPMEPQAGAGE